MARSCSLYRLGDLDHDRRHRYGDRPPPRRARPPRLSVRQELTDGTATMVITGELDLATVPALTWHLQQLLAQSPSRLVFDLAGVAFMDVAAARLITEATQSRPGAGRPVVRHPSPAVRRVLELTGFGALCEVEE